MSTEIMEVKEDIRLQRWASEVKACQESGMTVLDWCSENGIKPKNYYYHLKRVRESMLGNSVISISRNNSTLSADKIEIFSDELKISIPVGAPTESVAAIIQVLKSC